MKKILIIISILFLTGCYDYREINELEIVSSIFIDYKDDEYTVALEVLNTEEEAQEGSRFIKGAGSTIEEALNDTVFDSKKTPYYSHLNVAIATKDAVDNGLDKIYDYFARDIDIRKDFFVLITDDMKPFLEYKVEKGDSIGLSTYNTIKKSIEKNGRYRTGNFREITYHYLRDNIYFIGSVKIEDNNIALDETYAFKNNQLYLKVDPEAVLVLNMHFGDNKSFVFNDKDSYEIYEYGLKTDVKDNKATIELEGKVKLINMHDKVLSDDDIKKLNEELSNKVKKQIEDTISYSIKQDCDLLNLNYIYYLKTAKFDEDIWKNLDYDVKVKLSISEKGMLLDSLKGGKNEK